MKTENRLVAKTCVNHACEVIIINYFVFLEVTAADNYVSLFLPRLFQRAIKMNYYYICLLLLGEKVF